MSTKVCKKCNTEKPVSYFHKHKLTKDGLESYCRPCNQKRQTTRYLRNKRYIWGVLRLSECKNCTENNPLLLDFDHRDPKTKKKNVSQMIPSSPLWEIKEEIAKCDVLCSNCHRLKTAKDHRYYKEMINWSEPEDIALYTKSWLTIPGK